MCLWGPLAIATALTFNTEKRIPNRKCGSSVCTEQQYSFLLGLLMHRREFLKSVSAIALLTSTTAKAGLHFHGSSGTSGFNGGRSQGRDFR
jgi:hypothetical protein